MRIGIIGFGNMGTFLAKKLKDEVVWVMDSDRLAVKRFAKSRLKCGFYSSPPKDLDEADLVVEAASQDAVPLLLKYLPYSDIMIMSVGALSDEKLLSEMKGTARKYGRKIFVPSGAIGGLDAISSASDGIISAMLESTKNPSSLGRKDKERLVVFEGPAKEACRLFPKNVNVSATLSLAGMGFEKTMVRIVSDPAATKNRHKVIVESRTGRMAFEFENEPSPENPKTSALACLSALRRIRKLSEPLQIG